MVFIVWPFVWPRCHFVSTSSCLNFFVSFLFATVNYLIFAYKRYFSDALLLAVFFLSSHLHCLLAHVSIISFYNRAKKAEIKLRHPNNGRKMRELTTKRTVHDLSPLGFAVLFSCFIAAKTAAVVAVVFFYNHDGTLRWTSRYLLLCTSLISNYCV